MCSRLSLVLAAAICLGAAASVYAGAEPLESAYWRFEEGTEANKVPLGADTVLDSINENHMEAFTNPEYPGEPVNSPTYVADVPGPIVPATGEANHLALWFSGSYQDIFTIDATINNPLVDAFTLEASFNSEAIGQDLPWQAIVSKESKSDDLSDYPPFVLKITGVDLVNPRPPRLMLQLRDKANNVVTIESVALIAANQWYHAAVVATGIEVSLYLDENNGAGYVFQGSASIAGGGPMWQGPDGNDYHTVWNIGKGMWAREITDFFHGMIDEVRLTHYALEPSEFLWAKSPLPGDFNKDWQVDIDDLVIFEACATGPAITYNPLALPSAGCPLTPNTQGIIAADFDGDSDVDQTDFGVFHRCYGGETAPASDPNCAN